MKYQCSSPVVDVQLHTCAPLKVKVTFLKEGWSEADETLWVRRSSAAGEIDCHMQRFGASKCPSELICCFVAHAPQLSVLLIATPDEQTEG